MTTFFERTGMNSAAYEEQFGPVRRRVERLRRAIRWRIKGLLRRPRHILVECRWRLGDEVMAIPVYEALSRKHPRTAITVWCSYPDLLAENPFVHDVNTAGIRPDRYVSLRTGPRAVYRLEHYARRARVPQPEARPRLFYSDYATKALKSLPEGNRPLVAVSTGATWPTKRWPIADWRTLCLAMSARGWRIVQLGQGDEVIGVGTSLVDRTTVHDAACVLRGARLLVCCDSGLMHLALSVETPVVALFGPTDPAMLVRDERHLVAVTNGRTCQGCWNQLDGDLEEGVCPRNEPMCLSTITPEHVLTHVQEVLSREE